LESDTVLSIMPSCFRATLSVIVLASVSCAFARSTASNLAKPGSLPLTFEKNEGQAGAQYRYVLQHGLEAMFFQQGADFILPAGHGGETKLRLEFVSPSPNTTLSGVQRLKGESNYLLGSDASKFHTHIANYGDVRYEGMYPGITLDFYGNGGSLEHDFTIAAHADPSAIAFRFRGAKNTAIASNGDLQIRTTDGTLLLRRPVAYQTIDGRRQLVAADFLRNKNGQIGFRLGAFDTSRPLTIDPVFSFSTYLDGSLSDSVTAVTTDSTGNIYLTGWTGSADFPTHNAEQAQLGCATTSPGGCENAFITKLDPTGKTLIYSTYIGGSDQDYGAAIAVDASGNVIIGGTSESKDFPHAGAVPTLSCQINDFCYFLASLKPDGSGLNYSGQIGGIAGDYTNGNNGRIAVDATGNAYLAGIAGSSSFLITPGTLSSTVPGYPYSTLFVMKVDPTGKVIYSTVVVGNAAPDPSSAYINWFLPTAIAVDSSGDATVAGTAGPGLPTTSGVVGAAFPNNTVNVENPSAGFVLQLNPSASAINFATYVPGTDLLGGMAIDGKGDIYVAGETGETTLPTSANAYQATEIPDNSGGIANGYIVELNPQVTSVLAGTYLDGASPSLNGGTSLDAVALDSLGNVFVGGWTGSRDFPMQNPFMSEFETGETDAAMVLAGMNANLSALEFGSFLSATDGVFAGSNFAGLTVDSSNNLIVVGTTDAPDYPTTTGSLQTQPPSSTTPQSSYIHSFVSKLNMSVAAPSVCPASWSVSFGTVPALTTSKQTLNITNCGNAPLQFSSVTSSVSTITATQSCGAVAPGGTCPITLTFVPVDDSASGGTLSLADGAAISPQLIQIGGQGQAADLEPGSNPFNMGHLLEGTTGPAQTLYLNNKGNANMTIGAVSVSGGAFSITQNSCTFPVPGNFYCTVSLSFSPSAAGPQTGSLVITSNDPVHPQLSVSLTGTGDSAYGAPVVNSVLSIGNAWPQTTLPINNGPVNLTITGSNFYPQSVVQLGGVAQQTTFVSNTSLQVTIAATSLTALGEFPLSVVNPTPGGGASPAITMTTYQQVLLNASAITSDSATGLLYAAMPSTDPTNPNTVIPIDPTTGIAGTPIPVGQDPSLLATSSDGAYVYVANQTDLTVQRINLSTKAVDRTFPYAVNGSCSYCLTPSATYLQSVPGSPQEVVLAQGFQVALYNDSGLVNYVPNSFVEYNAPQFGSFAFAGNPPTLYAEPFTSVQSPFFTTVAITASGLQYTEIMGANYGPAAGTAGQVVSDGNLLYISSGEVWNPTTQQMTGSFPVSSIYDLDQSILLDNSLGQIFITGLGEFTTPSNDAYDALAISSYGKQSLAAEQMLTFPLINASLNADLVRWGTNGFGFLVAGYPGASGIYLMSSNALAGINPVPVLTSITPAQVVAGAAAFTVTLNGSGFVAGSVVDWNGTALATTVVSGTQLTATVPASDIATAGTAQITVTSPTPGGGTSSAQTFTIQAAVPGATISPTSLSFGSVGETITSASQAVTLTNSGNAALSITSIAAGGSFAETNTCGSSLAVGANCQIAVTFTPMSSGALTGSLTVTDNAQNSPQTVSLSGTGVVPLSLGAATGGSTSASVASGGTATYNLALTGTAGFSGNVSLSCSGVPQYASCTVNPTSINLTAGSSTNFTITVTTQSSASALLRHNSASRVAGVGIYALLLLPFCLRIRRRIGQGSLMVALTCLLLAVSGCGGSGGGSGGGNSTPSVTPAGTYTLAVTAISSGVSVQQSLTLTVQ
jgi:hypothetical protein